MLRPDRLEDVVRKRGPVFGDARLARVDDLPGEGDPRSVEDPARGFRQLGSDAVAGDQGDAVGHAGILAPRPVSRPSASPGYHPLMQIGVTLPLAAGDTTDEHVPTFAETVAFAARAEAAGLDSIWVFDHLLFRFPDVPQEGVREAWTTLSAVAAVVPRVELGSLVMCSSFRNPALMAKMAATLDDLSGGRVIVGLGSGWHDPEYAAFGYPTDHKVGRFAEDIEITARLLAGERVTTTGEWRQLADAELGATA